MSSQKFKVQNTNSVYPTGYVSSPDKGLLIIVLFLALIGLMMILSAGASKCVALGVNPGSFAVKQLFWFVMGLFGLTFLQNTITKNLKKLQFPLRGQLFSSLF